MTAKASTASIRWPAIERPSGVGSHKTATKAATASRIPQFEPNQVGFAEDEAVVPAGPDIVSMVAIKFPPRCSTYRGADLAGWLLSGIKRRRVRLGLRSGVRSHGSASGPTAAQDRASKAAATGEG